LKTQYLTYRFNPVTWEPGIPSGWELSKRA